MWETRRNVRVRPVAIGVALLGLAVPASAAAVDVPLKSLKTTRGSAQLVGEGNGTLLRLRPGAGASANVKELAAQRLDIAVRRGRCGAAPTMVVRVDGRRVMRRTVRWQKLRTLGAVIDLKGGDHRVDVVVLAHRRSGASCRPELRVRGLSLSARKRTVPIGAAVNWAAIGDDAYRRTFLREFDSLTPENEMKMVALNPSAQGLNFATSDDIVDFAADHGKAVRGHTLIWGLQLPGWLITRDFTAGTLAGVLRSHVATVVGHYRGRIPEWDVVNEPLNDDGSLAANLWTGGMGYGYVDLALRTAHEADPGAKLFINEIGTELSDAKFDGLIRLARDLQARGVPLHGIGLQNHATVDRFPSRARLAERMRRIAALGLEVQITEMDIAAGPGVKTPAAEIPERQAAAYRAAAEACNEVEACTRMTVWGVGDRTSWMGAAAQPLPLDRDFSPKPALRALREAFKPR